MVDTQKTKTTTTTKKRHMSLLTAKREREKSPLPDAKVINALYTDEKKNGKRRRRALSNPALSSPPSPITSLPSA